MYKKSNILFAMLLALALVISACAPAAPAEEPAAPAEPAAPEPTEEPAMTEEAMPEEAPAEPQVVGTIKIGAALSETGTYATIGLDVRQGYLLWVDYVNNELGGINVGGDLYDVELILYDDESDADTANRLIEQLISEDEVDFILGPYGSSLTIATSTITEQYGVIMIEANGAAETIFDRGYKYVFGVLSPASYYSKAAIEALDAAGAETIVVAVEDEAFSIAINDGVLRWAEEYGLEVLAQESYPKGNTDSSLFDPIMTKFKALNPDAYINAGHLNDGIAARASAQSLGFCPGAMVFMASANVPAFVGELGEKAEYAVGSTQWQETMSYQGIYLGTPQEYYERYVAMYGMDPSYQSAESTAAGFALQYALEQAGTIETEAVRQELLDMDIMTFYGAINFDETGKNVAHAMAAGQILDGKFQIVWPPEAAVADFVYPDPSCTQ
ncbi:MAG TPA: amino acid ABC transporter substrate-binding protein [Anaerolineales bacterium]|nr:amino acid ABC transporter substrate-binding protein [Anaerolineales bacterium]